MRTTFPVFLALGAFGGCTCRSASPAGEGGAMASVSASAEVVGVRETMATFSLPIAGAQIGGGAIISGDGN